MKISDILGVQNRPKLMRFLGESLAGCWVVGLITFTGYVLHFDSAPVGFLLLLDAVSILAGDNRFDVGLCLSRLLFLSAASDVHD